MDNQPRPLDDSARLLALSRLDLMYRPAPPGFARATRLAARLLEAPVVLVSLMDDRRQFFPTSHGLASATARARETPLTHSFCQHVVTSGVPLVISDSRAHPLVANHPAVSDLGVVAYAGYPLRDPEGFVLGALCAIDKHPRDWPQDQLDSLSELADLVMSEIALRHETLARAECEQTARRLARAAQSAHLAKNSFLANISHEIRTPVNAVVGFSDLLLGTPLDDDQRDCVSTIRQSGEDLLGFVGRVLELADLESAAPFTTSREFAVGELLRAAADRVRPAATAKSLALLVRVGHQVPARVLGDNARLRATLGHLLDNAVKFTAVGAITVEVDQQPDADQGSHRLRFTVRDTGKGIDTDDLERLFTPFNQLDASSTRCHQGTGLGLAIARRGVALLGGGDITVDSLPGLGSVFSFTLPFGAVAAKQLHPTA